MTRNNPSELWPALTSAVPPRPASVSGPIATRRHSAYAAFMICRRTISPATPSRVPAWVCAFAILACLAAGPQGTQALQIAEAGLAIDRPTAWKLGGVQGMGIVVNFIGSNDGMPSFSVQTDPEARIEAQTTTEQVEAQVEALFEAIALDRPGAEVVEAGWRTINGLRVHDSLAVFASPAGPIMNRRVILVHDERPWIFAWSDRRADWDRIDELVDACVESLRQGEPQGAIAD